MVDRIKTASAGSVGKWPATALAAWTLFVWGGRLRNLVIDPEGLGGASRWSLIGSVLFTALGVAVAVLLYLGRPKPEQHGGFVITASVLAALSIAVWLVRGIDIARGDHEVAFIAVHTVLALVSIGLGAWVMMSIRRIGRVETGPARYHQLDG